MFNGLQIKVMPCQAADINEAEDCICGKKPSEEMEIRW